MRRWQTLYLKLGHLLKLSTTHFLSLCLEDLNDESLENICLERFRGNHIDPELLEEGGHWLPFVDDIFTPLINTETGDFINFPYEGGYMKQPNKLMNLMRIIQMNYKRVRYEKASRVGVQNGK